MGPQLVSLLSVLTPTYACPGRAGAEAHPAGDTCADHKIGADTNPAASARRVELVGAEACAWTTGAMAQRVLERGCPGPSSGG